MGNTNIKWTLFLANLLLKSVGILRQKVQAAQPEAGAQQGPVPQ